MSIRRLKPGTLDRFDYAVIGVLFALSLATASIVWRGDRVGVRVLKVQPADGVQHVSSRASIQIVFAAPMVQAEVEKRLRISPPVEGVSRWSGSTLIWAPSQPLAYGEAYTVTLDKGGKSRQGRQVVRNVTWSFRVGQPRVLYLSSDEQQQLQLFALDPGGGSATQWTHASGDVWDYAVSPDGSAIAYSVTRKDGGSDLWQVGGDGSDEKLLLACSEASCSGPAWSADGKRLAYERKALSSSVIGVRSGPLAPRVWLLDAYTGETVPLFEDDQLLGSGPQWSPVGQRLAFQSFADAAVQVYDFDTGQSTSFKTLSGTGSWGPDGRQMAIPDTSYRGDREVSYIARVDLDSGQAIDLSQPETTGTDGRFWQDASPVWSPTGEWIAFGRFGLADGTRTWGQQLWLIRPDGSEVHPLVTDVDANLGAFAWRPDGSALVYVRVTRENLASPSPELRFVDLQEERPRLLATNAVVPGWLP